MRSNLYFSISILALFIVCVGFGNTVYAQDTNQDRISSRNVLLAEGCQLVLDPKLELADSISVEIINGIREVLPQIQSLIPADSVTINLEITNDPFLVLPEWGVGGVGGSPRNVSVYFDPDNPHFRVEYILQGLSHELYHASRCRMPRFYMSLLELFINEGLADQFMVEVFNCEQAPPFVALTEEQIQQHMLIVKPQIREKLNSWDDCIPWMWGRKGDDPIPHWTGFTIGSKIAKNYLRTHPEARASSLVLTTAEEIASATAELRYEEEKDKNQIASMTGRMNENNAYGFFTDKREDRTYKTVKIGDQIWMAENLNYKTDNGSWVYKDNATDSDSYGRLYNWEAACDVCPDGWHLPSDEQWKQLEEYLEMSKVEADTFGLRGMNVGTKLKSASGWSAGGNGTNESSFLALPSGYRFTNGGFYDRGYSAYFWTSTDFDGNQGWFRSLGYDGGDIGRNIGPKEYGFSIRCIKD